jgi:hypothetical protein
MWQRSDLVRPHPEAWDISRLLNYEATWVDQDDRYILEELEEEWKRLSEWSIFTPSQTVFILYTLCL